MSRTNYTSLLVGGLIPSGADVESVVTKFEPITTTGRDAIPNPVNGMLIYNSDNNLLEGYIDGSWPVPSLFCDVPQFDFAGSFPQTLSIVQTGLTEEVTITALTAGSSGGYSPTIASKSTTGNLSTETTFKSNTGGSAGILGCGINQLINTGEISAAVGLLLTGGGNGVLLDLLSGPIGSPFAVIYPFTFSVKINQAAGTATFEFADGVNDTSGSLTANSDYDNTIFSYCFGAIAGVGSGDVIVTEQNNGTSAFILANSVGKTCDYTTKTFCVFDESFNFHNGGAQIVAMDSGFVITTSLGNVADSIQVQSTLFSGTTGTTKAEAQYIEKSGSSTDQSGGVGYVDDSDGSTASVICGVIFLPEIGGGVLLDAQTQLPVETGVTMTQEDYFCWVDFDAAGSATYEDSEGNTGSLSVLGSYTAGDDIYKATICNAGSTATDTMTIGYNFGTKEYFDGTGNGYCEI